MNKNNKVLFRGVRLFNKYTFVILFIYFLLGTGATYAFYAYQIQSEDNIIVGNVVAIDVDLEVELVSGTTTKLVPMTDAALSNAINGVGSDNGACIDSVGNLSCQVYKITLTNNGSRLKHITGTVELYAKEGTDNVYSNLKWQELTDATTLKAGAVVNGMEKSVLVEDMTIESKEVKIWYIAVWLSETDSNQLNTDKGTFGGTVTFESGEVSISSDGFTETYLTPYAVSDEDIDFSQTSEQSGTNGIYLRSGTENDTYPIYYYRGEVDNNLIFAGFCWKIVRTTETGGLKLIYNGEPTDDTCNNTGTSSQIGTNAFDRTTNPPINIGYMYGNDYTSNTSTIYLSNVSSGYYFANDVIYCSNEETEDDESEDYEDEDYEDVCYESGSYYVLKDAMELSDFSTINDGALDNTHYTCLSIDDYCESVYYVYYASYYIDSFEESYNEMSEFSYITLTDGKKVEDALSEMLDYNTTSSTVKGNNTTEGTLDYWYYTNIEQNGFSDYVEDTVWCNDRTIYSLGNWDPNGGSMNDSSLYFSAYNRITVTYEPNLNCSRNIDSFTVSEENGNGDLDYPVGLLTADEIMLAGGKNNTNNTSYYLYTGKRYWSGSPLTDGSLFEVGTYGHMIEMSASSGEGVRPSISLKEGFSLTGDGDGTAENPYIVE